jgi:hypothetical protein
MAKDSKIKSVKSGNDETAVAEEVAFVDALIQACRMKVHNTVSAFLEETPKDKWLEMIAVAKTDLDLLEIWAKREISGGKVEVKDGGPRCLGFN